MIDLEQLRLKKIWRLIPKQDLIFYYGDGYSWDDQNPRFYRPEKIDERNKYEGNLYEAEKNDILIQVDVDSAYNCIIITLIPIIDKETPSLEQSSIYGNSVYLDNEHKSSNIKCNWGESVITLKCGADFVDYLDNYHNIDFNYHISCWSSFKVNKNNADEQILKIDFSLSKKVFFCSRSKYHYMHEGKKYKSNGRECRCEDQENKCEGR